MAIDEVTHSSDRPVPGLKFCAPKSSNGTHRDSLRDVFRRLRWRNYEISPAHPGAREHYL